ncbi:hypothetical protein M8C21_010802, partial [Ambrosia artemisiifolia]
MYRNQNLSNGEVKVALLVENGKFLLSAKRTRRTTCTEYGISMDAENISRSSNTYIGKLRKLRRVKNKLVHSEDAGIMARNTTDISRGRGFVARGGRGCGQGVVAGILFCVQGVMFFEALFLSIMQAQLAICCQELAGSWSRGRSQHSKIDQGLWCQADRGKKRGKVYGLSNAINPHVHGKQDEEVSGMSGKGYIRSFNVMQNGISSKNTLDIRELAIQFGCVRLIPLVKKGLSLYRERFIASLPPCRRASADFSRPVFTATGFYLCAEKHKVDKNKLIELSGTSEDESSSVSNFTMSPNVAKTVVCKYT